MFQWIFEKISEGLASSAEPPGVSLDAATVDGNEAASSNKPLRKWIGKVYDNSTLFDADGNFLTEKQSHNASTWRSHHAFSARCGLVKNADTSSNTSFSNSEEKDEKASEHAKTNKESVVLTAEQGLDAYNTWTADFYLRSTNTDPHILLTVAPRYFPYGAAMDLTEPEPLKSDVLRKSLRPLAKDADEESIYDRRMLETPLIWEEPFAFSVECSTRGLLLWSDQWEHFGRQISEKCLEPVSKDTTSIPAATEAGRSKTRGRIISEEKLNAPPSYEGFVRLQWIQNAQGHAEPESCAHDAQLSVFVGHERTDGEPSTKDGSNLLTDSWNEMDRLSPDSAARTEAFNTSVDAFSLTTSHENALKGSPSSSAPHRIGSALCDWQHICDIPLALPTLVAQKTIFTPYVTLMEGGDDASVL